MPKVFALGGATLDTIVQYEQMESLIHQYPNFKKSYLLLEEGNKIEVTQQQVSTGGGATNAAVSFQRQGYSVVLSCKVGNDLAGERVRRDLSEAGIDTQYFRVSDTEQTASSFVVPALSGDRTVFAFRGANASLRLEDIPLAQLAGSEFAYITSLSRAAAECFPLIVSQAKAQGVKVAVNPGISQLKLGSSFVKEALGNVDMLILNYEEAEQLLASWLKTQPSGGVPPVKARQLSQGSESLLDVTIRFEDSYFNLRQFFETMLNAGPRVVVVTHGKSGVYVATPQKLYFHPAPTVKVVNTLGAGDAFGSGITGAYYGGASIEDAIRCGLANSASVIAHPDAKTGLLTKAQMQADAGKFKQELLQEWTW